MKAHSQDHIVSREPAFTGSHGSLPRAGGIPGGCLQHDIFMHSGKKKNKSKERLVFRAKASRLPAFAAGHGAERCSH